MLLECQFLYNKMSYKCFSVVSHVNKVRCGSLLYLGNVNRQYTQIRSEPKKKKKRKISELNDEAYNVNVAFMCSKVPGMDLTNRFLDQSTTFKTKFLPELQFTHTRPIKHIKKVMQCGWIETPYSL